MALEMTTPKGHEGFSRLMEWIIWQIGLLGPMSVEDICRLSGLRKPAVYEAVKALVGQRYLVRIGFLVTSYESKKHRGPAYYHLTGPGWSQAMQMIDPLSHVTETHAPLKGTTLPHQHATNQFMIHLYELLEQERRLSLEGTGIIDWCGSRLASKYYELWINGDLRNPRRIRPDAMATLAFRDKQYEVSVELDRGTETTKILKQKILRYRRELDDKTGFHRRGQPYPVNILWVIDSPINAVERVDIIYNLIDIWVEDPFENKPNDNIIVSHQHWVTTLDTWLKATSLDDEVWWNPWAQEKPEYPKPSTLWVPNRTKHISFDPYSIRRLLL